MKDVRRDSRLTGTHEKCNEIRLILPSGSDDPAEYLGSDLQEDLTNLQLLYGLLWSQLTVRIPTVSTMLNCIGEKLKRTRQLLYKYDDGVNACLSQYILTSTTPFVVLQTAMAVQKRTIERCLVIENQPGPLVKKERRTTVRVRLLLNPAHLPPGCPMTPPALSNYQCSKFLSHTVCGPSTSLEIIFNSPFHSYLYRFQSAADGLPADGG